MRIFIKTLFICAVLPAAAFDSAEWLEKRAFLTHEADRLKAAYATYSAHVASPAENIAIPIEMFEDGSVKTSIFAKQVQYFLNEGFIWAKDVQVKSLKPDGTLDAQLDADNCVVDRNTKSGWCEGRATVVRDGSRISGTGVYFSSPESYVKVTKASEVDVVFSGEESKKATADNRFGALGKPTNAKVRSIMSDYDRDDGVAMYEGDVYVEYSTNSVMVANQLYMFVNSSNELNRVVAVGNVSITNETRIGRCSMATYRHNSGLVEMFGEEKGEQAVLIETADGSELAGDRIRFWVDAEQIEVENSHLKFMRKEEMKLL